MAPLPIEGDIYIDNERLTVPLNDAWSNVIAGRADFSINDDNQILYKNKIIYLNGVAVLSTDNTIENAKYSTLQTLAETEWVLNSTIDLSASFDYYINFLSNGAQYTALGAYDIGMESDAGLYYNMTRVCKPGIWIDEAYRTIEIKDGADVTNASFISWLEANAVQQGEPSGNKITFGNLPIASISFGNQKVIKMSLGNIDIYSDEEPTVAYSVTITASGNWASENVGYVLLYDGQDEATGAPLLEQNPASKAAFPQILSVESGYLYFRIGGNFVSGYDMTSNEYTIPAHGSSASQFSGVIPITGNGTINIQVGDFDD